MKRMVRGICSCVFCTYDHEVASASLHDVKPSGLISSQTDLSSVDGSPSIAFMERLTPFSSADKFLEQLMSNLIRQRLRSRDQGIGVLVLVLMDYRTAV